MPKKAAKGKDKKDKKATGKKDKKDKKEDKHHHAHTDKPMAEEKKSDGGVADPASVDFEAGLLFNRADTSKTGVITADDFRKLWRDVKTANASNNMTLPPAVTSGGLVSPISAQPLQAGLDPEALSFEAGKIFSTFDHDKDGRLDKTDFENLVKSHPELINRPLGMGSPSSNNGMNSIGINNGGVKGHPSLPTEVVTGKMLTHFDESAGVAIPRTSVEQHKALGNMVTPLIESYRARYDKLRNSVTTRLLPKREELLQYRRQLQNTSAEATAKRTSIERETIADGEEIIGRLRTVESMRQSSIKNQIMKLEQELETIERVVRRVEYANDDGLYQSATGVLLTSAAPGHTPVETVRAPRAAAMVELIQQFGDLSNTIEQVANSRPSIQLDFSTDDFPNETAERLEIMSKCDKYVHALSVKDHMLWEALQEKQKTEDLLNEERKLSHEYATEVSQWADMAQKLSQQNISVKQEKDKIARRAAHLVEKLKENGIHYEVPEEL
jgi:hypothetical protein